jgi:hypothetical protein
MGGDERMADHVRSGAVLRVESGDHICALVDGRTQRDAVLRAFLGEGLAAGHNCLVGLEEQEPWAAVRSILPTLDLERVQAGGQLTVLGAGDPQFSPDYFSVPAMLTFWSDVIAEAHDRGYDFSRLAAEARWWSPQLPGSDALVEYEISLNAYAERRPAAILCVYDFEEYGWMLVDLVKTHPRVLIDDVEFTNQYPIGPDRAATDAEPRGRTDPDGGTFSGVRPQGPDGGTGLASRPDAYIQRWLGPLIAHDVEYGGELVRTLATYLRSADDMNMTAQRLSIHPSSLRYRLYNIRRLTGLDLRDPGSRLGLMRATALWLRRAGS